MFPSSTISVESSRNTTSIEAVGSATIASCFLNVVPVLRKTCFTADRWHTCALIITNWSVVTWFMVAIVIHLSGLGVQLWQMILNLQGQFGNTYWLPHFLDESFVDEEVFYFNRAFTLLKLGEGCLLLGRKANCPQLLLQLTIEVLRVTWFPFRRDGM